MNRIIVQSAPRSGTHMLVRMIAKSLDIPWRVNVPAKKIIMIRERQWVIGVHDEYKNIVRYSPGNVKIICIKRFNGYEESLKNFPAINEFNIDAIINSMPEELTVVYDEIVKESEDEINKIKKILSIDNIEYEPWEKRYRGIPNWRQNK